MKEVDRKDWTQFQCPECPPDNFADFDASILLERQFEGLMFEVDKAAHTVKGKLFDEIYLSDYNMPKLLKQAEEIIDSDGEDVLYCQTCGEAYA